MTTNDGCAPGGESWTIPPGDVVMTYEEPGPHGARYHYMRLRPDIEAAILEARAEVKRLADEVRGLRLRLAMGVSE